MAEQCSDSFQDLSVHEVIRLHRRTLAELRRRGVIRTGNSPQGDWAELIVAKAYDGELAPNSEKSWDVLAADGRRVQVKSRVLDPERVGSSVTSPFRSWEFDVAVIVLFDDDLEVQAAVELPAADVEALSAYRQHVNGWVLRPTSRNLQSGTDVTEILRLAVRAI